MEKEIICTTCPMGCRITVQWEEGKEMRISGNGCPRGKVYAAAEVTNPTRVLTTSMRAANRDCMVSVKTSAPVPKAQLRALSQEIGRRRAELPVAVGDVLIRDLIPGVNVVATKAVE